VAPGDPKSNRTMSCSVGPTDPTAETSQLVASRFGLLPRGACGRVVIVKGTAVRSTGAFLELTGSCQYYVFLVLNQSLFTFCRI